MGQQDCNPDQAPALQRPLGTDKEGPEFAEQWIHTRMLSLHP